MDLDHPDIVSALECDRGLPTVEPQAREQRRHVELFRRSILIILSHSGPDAASCIEDVRADLNTKHLTGEITIEEKRALLALLNGSHDRRH